MDIAVTESSALDTDKNLSRSGRRRRHVFDDELVSVVV
jgi:hypothetical protein